MGDLLQNVDLPSSYRKGYLPRPCGSAACSPGPSAQFGYSVSGGGSALWKGGIADFTWEKRNSFQRKTIQKIPRQGGGVERRRWFTGRYRKKGGGRDNLREEERRRAASPRGESFFLVVEIRGERPHQEGSIALPVLGKSPTFCRGGGECPAPGGGGFGWGGKRTIISSRGRRDVENPSYDTKGKGRLFLTEE